MNGRIIAQTEQFNELSIVSAHCTELQLCAQFSCAMRQHYQHFRYAQFQFKSPEIKPMLHFRNRICLWENISEGQEAKIKETC